MAVELSLRVRVSAVELLMLELYSSRVKEFEVYGSASKPVVAAVAPWAHAPWELLGAFSAANRKGYQARALANTLPLPDLIATNSLAHRRVRCSRGRPWVRRLLSYPGGS